jgi:hypothetical protein
MTVLSRGLLRPRAWHTATVLPDGNVAIIGGVGVDGAPVSDVELFRRDTEAFELLPVALTARVGHTATLLTDGRVLVAGGLTADGTLAATADVWTFGAAAAIPVPATMAAGRRGHAATILPDGLVLLWGGIDGVGTAVGGGEIFDPLSQRFSSVHTAPTVTGGPALAGSLPADGATNVALDTVIAVRFSTPLRVESLNSTSVTLRGPQGSEGLSVIPAEEGRLAFVQPQQALLPGARYTLSVVGVVDAEGRSLERVAVTFSTAGDTTTASSSDAASSGKALTPAPRAAVGKPLDEQRATVDDEEWIPRGPGRWRTARPASPWPSLPPLQAPQGVAALAGQVLRLNGEPLADVTLAIGEASARTDATGRFLLTGAEPGVYALVIDGRTATRPGRTYGRFEANVEVKAGHTVVLPYTVWMPKLDTQHAVTIPTYTSSEVIVTTPRIPGLEFRIPAHAAIRDHDGNPVTEVSITPVPLDRPPFPLPAGVDVPVYFTIQPGGAYVYTKSGKGAALVYPNSIQAPPHTKFQFWDYHAERKGWYVYGLGTVAENGRQVVPDSGVRIYELTAAMVEGESGNAPPEGTAPASDASGGDPVDLTTGLFVLSKTDLTLPDVIPIALKRTYRTRDTISRAFGIGTNHPYDIFLVGNSFPYTW